MKGAERPLLKSYFMATIKNIHLLSVSDTDLKKLEFGAALHKKMSNIEFKILEIKDDSLVIRVSQGKHMSENYADKATLVTRTRELFEPFFAGMKIHPQVNPYEPNPVSKIDSSWIKKQMDSLGLRVTDIVKDTGVDKTNISAWANGKREMSQPVKAMFYHYFNYMCYRLGK
jgi:hypothetical protein